MAVRSPSENALYAIELEEGQRALVSESHAAANSRRLWRAMMLAPTLGIFEALLSGEAVPVDRLDREWVARLGRRA